MLTRPNGLAACTHECVGVCVGGVVGVVLVEREGTAPMPWEPDPRAGQYNPMTRDYFQVWGNLGQLCSLCLDNRAGGPFGFKLRHR